MKHTATLVLVISMAGFAAVPHPFSSGRPVVAQDVNENFTYLDTTVAKKADASVKIDLDATRSDLKALQAKEKSDSTTLASNAANGLTMAAVNSNLAGLRDSVVKKKDSAWILKAVTPGAIGALPVNNGNVDVPGALLVGSMVSAGGFQTGGNISAKSGSIDTVSVAAIRITSPNFHRIVGIGSYDSYSSSANTYGIYTPTLINSSIRLISDASSTTPFLSRNRSDGTWPKDIISVATDGGSSNTLVLGSDVSVEGSLVVPSIINPLIRLLNNAQATIPVLMQSRTDATIGSNLISVSSSGWGTNQLILGSNVEVAGSLAVRDSLSVKSVKIAMESRGRDVADYVFEPSYKLASLSDVESFAKQHRHLPEVPSASEIEKGGLDLAQMNLVLLKKVEELTLHAIEQEKAIAQQRQEMTEMKVVLESLRKD